MGAKKSGRRRGADRQGSSAGGTGESPGRQGRGKRHTPEERRAAVEAFHKSGLTQKAFARQWDVSHVTLGAWLRKHAAEGPKGLERVASGPAKRRGRAPLPAPVREEVVAVQRRFPDFGLKKIRHFLARFSALRVSTATVRRIRKAEGLPPVAVPVKRKRKAAPPRRFERSRPGDLWQTDITYLDVPWQKSPLYLIAYLDSCGATGYVESSAPAPQFRAFGLADSTLLRAIRAPRATREWTRRRATSCSRRSRRRQDMLSTRPLVSFRGQQPRSDSSCSHWHARATG